MFKTYEVVQNIVYTMEELLELMEFSLERRWMWIVLSKYFQQLAFRNRTYPIQD